MSRDLAQALVVAYQDLEQAEAMVERHKRQGHHKDEDCLHHAKYLGAVETLNSCHRRVQRLRAALAPPHVKAEPLLLVMPGGTHAARN